MSWTWNEFWNDGVMPELWGEIQSRLSLRDYLDLPFDWLPEVFAAHPYVHEYYERVVWCRDLRRHRCRYVRGKRHGAKEMWSPGGDGRLCHRHQYKHDELHGENTWWDVESGVLLGRERFARGERHGQQEMWFASGARRSSYLLVHGQMHGEVRIFHDNGQLAVVKTFEHDEQHEKDKPWRMSLRRSYTSRRPDGARDWDYNEIYSPHGSLLQGSYKEWHADGQIFLHCHYKDGRLHGKYKAWHADGSAAEGGQYAYGLRADQWSLRGAEGGARVHDYDDYPLKSVVTRLRRGWAAPFACVLCFLWRVCFIPWFACVLWFAFFVWLVPGADRK